MQVLHVMAAEAVAPADMPQGGGEPMECCEVAMDMCAPLAASLRIKPLVEDAAGNLLWDIDGRVIM